MSRYQFIEQVATTEPVQVLCRLLSVSAAAYYQWAEVGRPTDAWLGACGYRRLFAPCPALWHPTPEGRIARRRARYWGLRIAHLVVSLRLAVACYYYP
jgi:hypothetical protein